MAAGIFTHPAYCIADFHKYIYMHATPQTPSKMQQAQDEHEHEAMGNDGVTDIHKKCNVCEKLDEEECQVVTDYIVLQSKKLTLHYIIAGVADLMSQFPPKKKSKSFSAAHAQVSRADLENDILNHIWHCIAPRESCIRNTICNSVLLALLKKAQSNTEIAVAVKLLLQTQAAEKKA